MKLNGIINALKDPKILSNELGLLVDDYEKVTETIPASEIDKYNNKKSYIDQRLRCKLVPQGAGML